MTLKDNINATLFFLTLLCSLQLSAQASNIDETSKSHIKALIKQLGANDFKKREMATQKLLKLAYYARNEVKQALNSPDPEVRLRLKKIWGKIKWRLFPEAEDDVTEFIYKLQPVYSKYKEWDTLSKKYGPAILLLLLDLNKKKQYKRQVLNGVAALIKTTPLNFTAKFIEESPQKKSIIEMIKNLEIERLNKAESLKLVKLFNKLDLKQDSVMLTSTIWSVANSTRIPPIILGYFTDKKFTDEIFEIAREHLSTADTTQAKDWQLCFFAKLAKDINKRDQIKYLLDDIDYTLKDKKAMIYLAEILISMSLNTEAINALSELHTPRSIYLRAVAYNNAGNKNHSGTMMKILSKKITTEEICYSVAEEMNKFNDIRAVTLWLKIVKMKPDNSVYDSNALFHLASFYELKGKYAKAAEMLEKGINNKDGILLLSEKDGTISGKDAKVKIEQRINALKAQEKGGALIWFTAIKAMQKREYDTALEYFEKFIKNNPNYAPAYYNQAGIYITRKNEKKAIEALGKAIQYLKDDNLKLKISFILKQGILLRERGEYERTIKTIQKAVKLDPKNSEVLTMLAMTHFYAGNYKKATKLFEKCYELNPDDLYAPIWHYISQKKIQSNIEIKNKFAKFADTINGDKWPIPIIQYYAEKISKTKCLQKTESKNKKRENEKRCEAYYFIGEFLLLSGKKEEAIALFKKCIECGIKNFREYKAAEQELELLISNF